MSNRYSVGFLLLGLCLTSCNQKEKPEEQPAAPVRPIISFGVTQEMIDSFLTRPASERPANPDSAAAQYLVFPPKSPIPPHFLPATELSESRRSGDTVYYRFRGPHAPVWGEMAIIRVGNGKDSGWIMTSFEHLPPPQ